VHGETRGAMHAIALEHHRAARAEGHAQQATVPAANDAQCGFKVRLAGQGARRVLGKDWTMRSPVGWTTRMTAYGFGP
jgi:hypothetical protein